MDAVDTLARISQLLLSRRISANLVVGVLFAVGIGGLGYFVWPTIFTDVLAFGTTLCALLLVILLTFGYGLANLFNGVVIDLGSALSSHRKDAYARRQADADAARAKEQQENNDRQRVERLCKLIPHFTHHQLELLKFLNDEIPEHEIAWNRYEFYSEYSHLLNSGFLCIMERDLPDDKELYRLTPKGADAIRLYRARIASQPDSKLLSQGEDA